MPLVLVSAFIVPFMALTAKILLKKTKIKPSLPHHVHPAFSRGVACAHSESAEQPPEQKRHGMRHATLLAAADRRRDRETKKNKNGAARVEILRFDFSIWLKSCMLARRWVHARKRDAQGRGVCGHVIFCACEGHARGGGRQRRIAMIRYFSLSEPGRVEPRRSNTESSPQRC